MKTTITVILFYFLATTTSKSQNVEWAKSVGGTGFDQPSSISIDAIGNIYSTGTFQGTADFDPGSGVANRTSVGLDDIFVMKMDPIGNLLWVRSFGGMVSDAGLSIIADTLGNIYTTGYFQGTVDFDPGLGIANRTSTGDWDIFVLKMDISGNFLWVNTFGGIESDIGYSIGIDPSGNIYTTGSFVGTVDFNPGVGTTNLTSAAGRDIFVQKMDALGNFLWAKSFGTSSIGSNDVATSICFDAIGNVYATGCYKGTGDFDPGTGVTILTSFDGYEIFLHKMDSSGNFLWVKSFGGATGNDRETFSKVDAFGNLYTTGRFEGMVDFDPGPGIAMLISAGLSNTFVQKLDASGNFLWVRSFGGNNFDGATSLSVDALSNVYTTGYFSGIVDFDPGAGTAILTSAGADDIFVHKMDASGNFLWAKSFGGTGMDRANCISLDALENVYTTGQFQGNGDYGTVFGTTILSSAGANDIFIQKMNSPPLPISLKYFRVRKLNEDVELFWASEYEINNKYFTIERSANCIDWEMVQKIDVEGNSGSTRYYHIVDDKPLKGISYYRLKQMDVDGKYTFSSIQSVTFEMIDETVNIYPNPNTGTVWLTFEKEIRNAELVLTDVQGKVIYKSNFNRILSKTLDLKGGKGIYLLTIKTKNGQTTKKLLKE